MSGPAVGNVFIKLKLDKCLEPDVMYFLRSKLVKSLKAAAGNVFKSKLVICL